MKKIITLAAIAFAISTAAFALEKTINEPIKVPAKVKTALHEKYPESKNGGDRNSKDFRKSNRLSEKVPSFAKHTSDKTGKSVTYTKI